MIKSILVAVDGSEYTDPVMKHAIQFALAFDSKLHIVSVVDIRIFEWSVYLGVNGFAPVMPSSAYLHESRQILQEKAEKVLEKCRGIADAANVSYSAEKLEGTPREIISQESLLTDMIMLGARGEFAKWGSGRIMGATVDAISRECIKPIFISPLEFREIGKILAPYDGSFNSNRALPYAGFLAAKFNAGLTVLSVDKNSEVAHSVAEEGKKYFESHDLVVEIEVRKGNPDEEILNFADESEIDCIVMGAYGHSRIREAILGSITERVMRNAKMPLILVK